MTVPFRPSRTSVVESRRSRVDQVNQVAVDDTMLIGRIHVVGLGEMSTSVQFPVLFSERPFLLGQGVEMADDTPEAEHIPDVDLAVIRWDKGPTGTHFRAADLAVRVGGRSEQRLWVNYCFFGKALSSTAINVVEEGGE